MRISDWSSDVCSSDLVHVGSGGVAQRACLGSAHEMMFLLHLDDSLSGSGLWGRKGSKNRPFRGCQGVRGAGEAVSARASDAAASHRARAVEIGRASCRERVCQYGEIPVGAVSLKNKK